MAAGLLKWQDAFLEKSWHRQFHLKAFFVFEILESKLSNLTCFSKLLEEKMLESKSPI
jgi:hypothetical protein